MATVTHAGTTSNVIESPVSATELQRLLEAENARLAERGEYEAMPIRVLVQWAQATTMVIIDTPGLLSAPQVLFMI